MILARASARAFYFLAPILPARALAEFRRFWCWRLRNLRNSVGSGDCTGHAETNLMRIASLRFEREVLASATLYTSTEPCAMCSGAIYWGGVRRVVYALSERSLLAMTGADPENPTFDLPCREVFAHGQRPVEVIGPLLEEEAAELHEGFWTG